MKRYIPILIFLVAAGLRLFQLSSHGLWLDEKTTALNALGWFSPDAEFWQNPHKADAFTPDYFWKENTVDNVVKSTLNKSGGNNLLFNVILHHWIGLFGTSDFAMRALSWLSGLLVVILGYTLCVKYTENKRLALFFAALLAVHPLLIAYSQELRAYALTALLCLWASFTLLRLTKRAELDWKSWILYGLLALLALLSHYLAVGLLLGHFVFFLFQKPGTKHWIGLAIAAIVPLFLLSMWLFFGGLDGVFELFDRSESYSSSGLADSSLQWSLYGVMAGIMQDLLHVFGNSLQNFGWRVYLLLPALLIPVLALIYARKSIGRLENNLFQLAVICTSVYFLFQVGITFYSGHLVSLRAIYFTIVAPISILILAIAADEAMRQGGLKQKIAVVLAGLQLAIMVFSSFPTYTDQRSSVGERGPNPYATFAASVKEKYEPGDVLVYVNWYDAKLLNLYFRDWNIEQRVVMAKTEGYIVHQRGESIVQEVKLPTY